MTEEPICKVTIIAMLGANARVQMDEKSAKVNTYPNGSVIPGYAVLTSGEGIVHVRVSEMGKPAQWIRCWEKNGSNPIVSIDFIVTPSSAIMELAKSIDHLASVLKEKK